MSAKHCAKPTFSASSQVMSSTRCTRAARAPRSTRRMMIPPTMKASATGTGLNRCALMKLPKSRPSTAAGRNAHGELRPQARIDAEKARAVFPHHGEHRAGLDGHVEHVAAGMLEIEQIAGEDQVAGGRDGQELGQALDDAEDQRIN